MSQTITIPDELYAKLDAEAQERGLGSVAQLLEENQRREEELRRRRAALRRADEIRERVRTQIGIMPDSTALLREDRER